MITKILKCSECTKEFSFSFPSIIFGKSGDTIEGMKNYIWTLGLEHNYSYGKFVKHRGVDGELTDCWICEECDKKIVWLGAK